VVEKNPPRLPGRWNIFGKVYLVLAAAFYLYYTPVRQQKPLYLCPLFKDVAISSGRVFYCTNVILVLLEQVMLSSNDGLGWFGYFTDGF